MDSAREPSWFASARSNIKSLISPPKGRRRSISKLFDTFTSPETSPRRRGTGLMRRKSFSHIVNDTGPENRTSFTTKCSSTNTRSRTILGSPSKSLRNKVCRRKSFGDILKAASLRHRTGQETRSASTSAELARDPPPPYKPGQCYECTARPKTPDDYLCELISAVELPRTPDDYLCELILATETPKTPESHLQELIRPAESISKGTVENTQGKFQSNDEEDSTISPRPRPPSRHKIPHTAPEDTSDWDETCKDFDPGFRGRARERGDKYRDLLSRKLGSPTWNIINIGADIQGKPKPFKPLADIPSGKVDLRDQYLEQSVELRTPSEYSSILREPKPLLLYRTSNNCLDEEKIYEAVYNDPDSPRLDSPTRRLRRETRKLTVSSDNGPGAFVPEYLGYYIMNTVHTTGIEWRYEESNMQADISKESESSQAELSADEIDLEWENDLTPTSEWMNRGTGKLANFLLEDEDMTNFGMFLQTKAPEKDSEETKSTAHHVDCAYCSAAMGSLDSAVSNLFPNVLGPTSTAMLIPRLPNQKDRLEQVGAYVKSIEEYQPVLQERPKTAAESLAILEGCMEVIAAEDSLISHMEEKGPENVASLSTIEAYMEAIAADDARSNLEECRKILADYDTSMEFIIFGGDVGDLDRELDSLTKDRKVSMMPNQRTFTTQLPSGTSDPWGIEHRDSFARSSSPSFDQDDFASEDCEAMNHSIRSANLELASALVNGGGSTRSASTGNTEEQRKVSIISYPGGFNFSAHGDLLENLPDENVPVANETRKLSDTSSFSITSTDSAIDLPESTSLMKRSTGRRDSGLGLPELKILKPSTSINDADSFFETMNLHRSNGGHYSGVGYPDLTNTTPSNINNNAGGFFETMNLNRSTGGHYSRAGHPDMTNTSPSNKNDNADRLLEMKSLNKALKSQISNLEWTVKSSQLLFASALNVFKKDDSSLPAHQSVLKNAPDQVEYPPMSIGARRLSVATVSSYSTASGDSVVFGLPETTGESMEISTVSRDSGSPAESQSGPLDDLLENLNINHVKKVASLPQKGVRALVHVFEARGLMPEPPTRSLVHVGSINRIQTPDRQSTALGRSPGSDMRSGTSSRMSNYDTDESVGFGTPLTRFLRPAFGEMKDEVVWGLPVYTAQRGMEE